MRRWTRQCTVCMQRLRLTRQVSASQCIVKLSYRVLYGLLANSVAANCTIHGIAHPSSPLLPSHCRKEGKKVLSGLIGITSVVSTEQRILKMEANDGHYAMIHTQLTHVGYLHSHGRAENSFLKGLVDFCSNLLLAAVLYLAHRTACLSCTGTACCKVGGSQLPGAEACSPIRPAGWPAGTTG